MIDEFDLLAHPGEAVVWRNLEARLAAEYSPTLGRGDVERCLLDSIAMFAAAPIRTYLAILVERDARHRLVTATRRSAQDPTDLEPGRHRIREPVTVGSR